MAPDTAVATALYAVSVPFAVLTAYYVTATFDLAVPVQSSLFAFAFVGFAVAGFAVESPLDLVAFAYAGVAAVAVFWYVVTAYELGATGKFLLSLVAAALFVATGYAVGELDPSIVPGTARTAIVGLAIAGGLLVAVDSLGGGVAYVVTPSMAVERVEYLASARTLIRGEIPVDVRNGSRLTRPAETRPSRLRARVAGTSEMTLALESTSYVHDEELVDLPLPILKSPRRSIRPGQTVAGSLSLEIYVDHPNVDAETVLPVEVVDDLDAAGDRAEPTVLLAGDRLVVGDPDGGMEGERADATEASEG